MESDMEMLSSGANNGAMDTDMETTMDLSNDAFLKQLQALRTEIRDLRTFSERQQDSITSLIALSQQQTGIIEKQNALIQQLAVPGMAGPNVGIPMVQS